MCCEVEQFDENGNGGVLRVKLENGERLHITMWTDMHKTNVRHFPVRMGYGSAIHKHKEANTNMLLCGSMLGSCQQLHTLPCRMLLGWKISCWAASLPSRCECCMISIVKQTKARLPGQAGKKEQLRDNKLPCPGRREQVAYFDACNWKHKPSAPFGE